MAIAYDNATAGTRVTSGTTMTFSHTCSGSDRILFVTAVVVNPVGNTASGVTYNGVAMTRIDTASAQSNVLVSLWYLKNPDSGANNVVITSSATIGSYMDGIASSYTGADQSGGMDASTKATGAATSFSGTVTTVADNCWTVAGVWSNGNPAASTGSTTRVETNDRTLIADSNGAKTPAGSTTMNFTAGIADSYGLVMASFAPATAGGANTTNFFLMM